MVDFLDTFIGLFSIYLLLSLIVTAITQGITSSLNTKGAVVSDLVINLVGKDVKEEIFNHEKFKELCSKRFWHFPRNPSYIKPAVFADILLDLKFNSDSPNTKLTPVQLDKKISVIRSAVSNSTSAPGKRLIEFWESSDFSLEVFNSKIVDWFNLVSERSYGWHKRRLNRWLLAVGIVIAAAINADSGIANLNVTG